MSKRARRPTSPRTAAEDAAWLRAVVVDASLLRAVELLGAARSFAVSAIIDALTSAPYFRELLARFPRRHVCEYARFIVLKTRAHDTSNVPTLSPSGPVDAVWHAHMLVPRSYVAMCRALAPFVVSDDVDFDVFAHDPATANDVGARAARYVATLRAYELTFGPGSIDAELWPAEADDDSDDSDDNNNNNKVLTVKTLTGTAVTCAYLPGRTLGSIARALVCLTNVPRADIRLVYAGKIIYSGGDDVVDAPKTLAQLGIRPGSVAHMVKRLTGC